MRRIAKPSQDPLSVFHTCVSRIQDIDLKTRLMSVSATVASGAGEYEVLAARAELFRLKPQTDVCGVVTAKEMNDVYTLRMAKQLAIGRAIYDKLRSAPPQGTCPLCGQRVVAALDHHLPKAMFPIFSVLPVNLIPSCSECNKIKHDKFAENAETQTIHPYFDDIDNDIWLRARVIETSPAAVLFYVDAPDCWQPLLAQRVNHHFETFNLAGLYSSHAAVDLAGISYRLDGLHRVEGVDGVRNHLRSEAESRIAAYRNSWQAAFYSALADSQWYCEGGFREC